MIKETGDSKRANATGLGGDGGKILAVSDGVGEVTFKNAIFAGSASVDND